VLAVGFRKPPMSLELAFIVIKIAKLGVGIEENNAGIGIPASMIQSGTGIKKCWTASA
jgi:hypothetical protein